MDPFHYLRRALLPAALVVLVLGPVFFHLAEGSTLREIDGHYVDVYGIVLYAIFLVALVGGVYAVYRSI